MVGFPLAVRVQPEVVDHTQSQSQEEADSSHNQPHLQEGPTGQPGAAGHPGAGQQHTVTEDEDQVDDGPASGAAPSHIEPGEIKDDCHCHPVEPLRSGVWHKFCALKPDPEQQYQPQAEEMQGHIVGEESREQGNGQDPGPQEQQVPQEVDGRGAPAQAGLRG